jgi:1-acyl-sn-glycerol-3-phosphate acyltransferase
MLQKLRSLAIWVAIASLTALYFPPAVLISMLGWMVSRRSSAGHEVARFWARSILALNPAWSFSVDARRLQKGRAFVVVSNHESAGDIIICLRLPLHFKFISKASNFRVPFMGWFMWFAGYVPLTRGNKESIVRCMARCRWWLDQGVSVLFYPEGTRSPDGSVRAFKPGAFQLAIEGGVDVLPVVVLGTSAMLQKNSLRFASESTPMRVIVGEPIPVAGLGLDDVSALAERARAAIVAMKEREGALAAPEPVRAVATG